MYVGLATVTPRPYSPSSNGQTLMAGCCRTAAKKQGKLRRHAAPAGEGLVQQETQVSPRALCWALLQLLLLSQHRGLSSHRCHPCSNAGAGNKGPPHPQRPLRWDPQQL